MRPVIAIGSAERRIGSLSFVRRMSTSSEAAPQTDEIYGGAIVGDTPAAVVLAGAGSLARNIPDRVLRPGDKLDSFASCSRP
jgi:hypothetical protein